MADINDARRTFNDFLKTALASKEFEIIRTAKVGEGWEAEAEVYEESSFIKALGLPTRVRDRNIYQIKMTNGLEVESFERKG